ncbi:DUF3135 domain-containing protein [Teredinibacter sp. KSP-S5-2]|uniref:DUF3135 domain-containing protein n=1 Tax=Teredinibacter sp. KSP-S5-2 TaxID=3034506 RepID=UPI002934D63E|nr:DUF3135 domain-containing protein [Teredinibacter sp. KSP-S5-2]WNO10114.1 DUF3135 domain-containing protein [Teredinibacter sp. KSP-S5-2]
MSRKLPHIDQLIKLAQSNPTELEEIRLREIEALISSAPEEMQKRLRGLQFQIDCRRQLHKTSLGSCISISQMMHESVGKLNSALHGLTAPKGSPQGKTADIIEFPVTA